MSLSLYHIDRSLEDLVDNETGEVLDYEAFESLQMARDAKIEGIACWTKNLDAEAKAIRAEELELTDRRKKLERKRERLLDYLNRALDGRPFQSARCAISYRKSTPVEITNMDELVQWCIDHGHEDKVQYAAPTVGKSDIAPLLKAGVEVEGAEIATKWNMGVK